MEPPPIHTLAPVVTGRPISGPLSTEGLTDPKRLRELVERLDTEPGWRERVAEFQGAVREGGGAARAAEALLRFASASAAPSPADRGSVGA
jgi:hypothetical protein